MADSHIDRISSAIGTATGEIVKMRQGSDTLKATVTTTKDHLKAARETGVDANSLASLAGFSVALHATGAGITHTQDSVAALNQALGFLEQFEQAIERAETLAKDGLAAFQAANGAT